MDLNASILNTVAAGQPYTVGEQCRVYSKLAEPSSERCAGSRSFSFNNQLLLCDRYSSTRTQQYRQNLGFPFTCIAVCPALILEHLWVSQRLCRFKKKGSLKWQILSEATCEFSKGSKRKVNSRLLFLGIVDWPKKAVHLVQRLFRVFA